MSGVSRWRGFWAPGAGRWDGRRPGCVRRGRRRDAGWRPRLAARRGT